MSDFVTGKYCSRSLTYFTFLLTYLFTHKQSYTLRMPNKIFGVTLVHEAKPFEQ